MGEPSANKCKCSGKFCGFRTTCSIPLNLYPTFQEGLQTFLWRHLLFHSISLVAILSHDLDEWKILTNAPDVYWGVFCYTALRGFIICYQLKGVWCPFTLWSPFPKGFTSAKCKMVWKSQLNNSATLNSHTDPSRCSQMLPDRLSAKRWALRCSETTSPVLLNVLEVVEQNTRISWRMYGCLRNAT